MIERLKRRLGHLVREWWTALASSLPNDVLSMRLRGWMYRVCGVHLEHPVYICRHVLILGHVTIGQGSSVSNNTCINGAGAGILIGKKVMIAPGCCIVAFDHDISLGPQAMIDRPWIESPIVIEDDVWIAANCTITRGAHIGKGAVVGANSVVTGPVPANAIVAGAPARLIRYRSARLEAER
jgi:acetyltransferase-like isoleucine patch superfamily enzyme